MSRYAKSCIVRRSAKYPRVAPYNRDKLLYGKDRWRIQNQLLRQHRFPGVIHPKEYALEVWSHIENENYLAAIGRLRTDRYEGVFFWDDSTDESFLDACQCIVGKRFRATGGAATLFYHPDSDKPIVRLSIVGIYNELRSLFSDNEGAHVSHPRNQDEDFSFDPEHLPGAYAGIFDPPKRPRGRPWATSRPGFGIPPPTRGGPLHAS